MKNCLQIFVEISTNKLYYTREGEIICGSDNKTTQDILENNKRFLNFKTLSDEIINISKTKILYTLEKQKTVSDEDYDNYINISLKGGIKLNGLTNTEIDLSEIELNQKFIKIQLKYKDKLNKIISVNLDMIEDIKIIPRENHIEHLGNMIYYGFEEYQESSDSDEKYIPIIDELI